MFLKSILILSSMFLATVAPIFAYAEDEVVVTEKNNCNTAEGLEIIITLLAYSEAKMAATFLAQVEDWANQRAIVTYSTESEIRAQIFQQYQNEVRRPVINKILECASAWKLDEQALNKYYKFHHNSGRTYLPSNIFSIMDQMTSGGKFR